MMERRSGPASLEDSPAAALYERYATTVFAYLRRRLPSREDAEDMLLEVFLAAFERSSLVGLAEEERRRLGAALQQLEPHQRQVLYLRFSLGLRCAQIGLVMGKREDAVRKLLSRTLSSLRTLYGER